jgi:hypothetical protein
MKNEMTHPPSTSTNPTGALKCVAILLVMALTNLIEADPLDTWSLRSGKQRLSSDSLYGIAYGNGQFVAVGHGTDGSSIWTSADTVHWVQHQSPIVGHILYANGLFVASGGTNADGSSFILTSADGVNWTARPSPPEDALGGIAYGNGRFVAVANSGILSSADGVNWTDEGNPAGSAYGLSSVCYGNGHFVVIGYWNDRDNCGADACAPTSLNSVDGVNWVRGFPGTTSWLTGVAYGNGLFVAVGLPDGTILTSVDGINWVQRDSRINHPLSDVTYGGGQFVAVGKASVVTSSDGTNWVERPTPSFGYLSGIAYGQGQFVAVGGSWDVGLSNNRYGHILTSADGVNWIDPLWDPADWLPLFNVAFGNGQFVAVGNRLLNSRDGATWAQLNSMPPADSMPLSGIAFGNGQFVAVGDFDGPPFPGTSTNGLDWTWTWRDNGMPVPLHAVSYGNGQFVAMGPKNSILTSNNGINWVQRFSGITNWLNGIAYGNGLFVAVGQNNLTVSSQSLILTSADAVDWIPRHSGTNLQVLSSIAYGNGRFVAVGTPGSVILTSADGIEWNEHQSGITGVVLNGIAYGSGQFVAVGRGFRYEKNAILSSADGENWVAHQSGTTLGLNGVGYGNRQFIAVGDASTILQSGPIITMSLTPGSSGGRQTLSLLGPAGLAYTIQSSSDLVTWTDLTNITSVQPTLALDVPSPLHGHLFYRAYGE